MRHKLTEGKDIKIVAAEPASCPKLTRGQFQYDFGDEAGYTPLIPMFTLGHNFSPANIHAGGLRYHGAGSIVSQLLKDKMMEAVDIQQLETFKAATLFARAEGIIPAPESSHAIAAAIREAEQAKLEGKQKTILFNLSGHGLIDMAAYDRYFAGDLTNYEVTDEEVANNLKDLEKISGSISIDRCQILLFATLTFPKTSLFKPFLITSHKVLVIFVSIQNRISHGKATSKSSHLYYLLYQRFRRKIPVEQ